MGIGVFGDGVKIKTREGGKWPGFNTLLLLSALRGIALSGQ
jgi:hypothetical protein